MTETAVDRATAVRLAVADDDRTLVELAAACPMAGDMSLCVRREPEFLALNRLEGDALRVGVVDGPNGRPIACAGVGFRPMYVNGEARPASYTGDMKVHPDHRTLGISKALTFWIGDQMHQELEDVIGFATTLRGNTPILGLIESMASDPRFSLDLVSPTWIRTYSVMLLWKRKSPDRGLRVERATKDDIEEMVALWREVAPTRQATPVHDVETFARWLDDAPGLDISSYLLARRGTGQLAGFFGLWDQRAFKQMHVEGYSRGFNVARHLFNTVSPIFKAAQMPEPGGEVEYKTVVNQCIPLDGVDVMRSLLIHAYNELRAGNDSFFTIGLDHRDPLAPAMKGLLAQTVDVDVWLLRPRGSDATTFLDDRPLHFEIALA